MKKTTVEQPKPARPAKPQAHPKPAAKPAAEPKPPTVALTPFQERMCDVAADLLINGGSVDDANLVLLGLARHSLRYVYLTDGRQPDDKTVAETPAKWLPEMRQQLIKHWPLAGEKERVRELASAPKTVAEFARAGIRARLTATFSDWLGASLLSDGALGELYFLQGVLENVVNDGDRSLPEAFALEIGLDHTWVRVPRDHVERVEEIVALIANRCTDRQREGGPVITQPLLPASRPITDEEVDRYVAIRRLLDAALLSFRKRVSDGAPIQTSKYQVTCDPITDEEYEVLRKFSYGSLFADSVTICGFPGEDLPTSPERPLAFMHAILQAYDRNTGCTTPAEAFLLNLVRDYGDGFWLSPDSVRTRLEEFENDFTSAIEDAKHLVRQYPEHFEEARKATP